MNSITPASARAGEKVTIAGSGFAVQAYANVASFGGHAAITLGVNAAGTLLTVEVPPGLPPGSHPVKVDAVNRVPADQPDMAFTVLGPRLEFAAGPLSFGTGGMQTVVLSNTGTVVLHLHSVVPAHPDFEISGVVPPMDIAVVSHRRQLAGTPRRRHGLFLHGQPASGKPRILPHGGLWL